MQTKNTKATEQVESTVSEETRSLSENRNEKLFSPNTISFNFDTEPEKLQLISINNQYKQYVMV